MRNENSRVILWVMCDCQKIRDKVSERGSRVYAVDETLKIREKYWPFLYLNFTRVLQFSSTSHAYKMVIATVCVQIDDCFCNS